MANFGYLIRDAKTGELVRVPIKGRDLAIIGAVSFDKLRLAENQPTKIVQHESEEERMKIVIEDLENIATAYDRGDAAEVTRLARRMGVTNPLLPTKPDKDN